MKSLIMCPACYRYVPEGDAGVLSPHSYMPMLAGAVCAGGGKTPEVAKAEAVATLRDWIKKNRKKPAK